MDVERFLAELLAAGVIVEIVSPPFDDAEVWDYSGPHRQDSLWTP